MDISTIPAYNGIPLGHLPGSKGEARGDDSWQALRNGCYCQRDCNLEVVQSSLQLRQHAKLQVLPPRVGLPVAEQQALNRLRSGQLPLMDAACQAYMAGSLVCGNNGSRLHSCSPNCRAQGQQSAGC